MINTVRRLVLALINKENNGYITPDEFNLFAEMAHKDVFLEYTREYAEAIRIMNMGGYAQGYSNIVEKCEALIDKFTPPPQTLVYSGGAFGLPVDAYKVNYLLYQGRKVEYASQGKIIELNQSDAIRPTTLYPVYTISEGNAVVYPLTIQSGVSANFIRYPLVPKWTYVVVPGSDAPLFNIGAPDYQDFELPDSDMIKIVIRICQYAGVSIREEQVVQMSKSEELQDKQER